MGLVSNLIEKTSGKAKVSLLADVVDGQFVGVSFGIMTYNDTALDGYISLTPYGLEHTYEGEHKDAVDKALKKAEEKIASDYNITFNEPPQMEEMAHPEEETASEEMIAPDEVGSLEDIINS